MTKDWAERLREDVRAAPDPEWIHDIWKRHYATLGERLLSGNLNNFLQWHPIGRTMHTGPNGGPARSYLRTFRNLKDFDTWARIAEENPLGKPSIYSETKYILSPTSVKHTIHLQRFQNATGLQIKDMKYIFEFGGGYGSMRRIMDRMGFEGEYVVYDMPLMCALQRFYLGTLVIDVEFHWRLDSLQSNLQHFAPESSLFIATFSLSETPLEIRYLVMDLVKDFQAILIGFAKDLDRRIDKRINNKAHFAEWQRAMKQHTWHQIPIKENKAESYYLFGVRK